jgi:hypothetical protein
MLLDHGQAFELCRFDLDRVHRSAAAADILDLCGHVSNRIPYSGIFGCFGMPTILASLSPIFGIRCADAK